MSGARCLVCHATREITIEMAPSHVAELVRAFTAAHAHGPVIVSTPGPVPGAARRPQCGWCGKSTTSKLRDEDGETVCAKCHGLPREVSA